MEVEIGKGYLSIDSCPVCSNIKINWQFDFEYTSEDVLKGLGIQEKPQIALYKCDNCGHRFSSPIIHPNLLDKYYSSLNKEYYPQDTIPVNNRQADNEFVVRKIERIKKSGKVLEIGSGYGFLLQTFNPNNWQCIGIDPSQEAVEFGKNHLNLNLLNTYLSKDTFKGEQFDVILMFDVLEHLVAPNEMMELVNYYLKDDGLLVLGTGNITSLNALIGRSRWNYFCTYLHISFFSLSSIKNFLNINNFEEVASYRKSYMGSFSDNLKIFIRNIFKALIIFVAKPKKPYRIINAFDHMVVISRKALNQ